VANCESEVPECHHEYALAAGSLATCDSVLATASSTLAAELKIRVLRQPRTVQPRGRSARPRAEQCKQYL
jgi:hypothetical protein